MLKTQWEYFLDNIHKDDSPVACLHKRWYPSNIILMVYEAPDHYYAIPFYDAFSFIKTIRIPYEETFNVASIEIYKKYGITLKEGEQIPSVCSHDFSILCLKEACKIIEEKFMEQAEAIIQLLS